MIAKSYMTYVHLFKLNENVAPCVFYFIWYTSILTKANNLIPNEEFIGNETWYISHKEWEQHSHWIQCSNTLHNNINYGKANNSPVLVSWLPCSNVNKIH